MKKETVNHPAHYNQGSIEAIEVIEDWGLDFHLGNALKYICRAGHKDDNYLEDLKKALWYIERRLKLQTKIETKKLRKLNYSDVIDDWKTSLDLQCVILAIYRVIAGEVSEKTGLGFASAFLQTRINFPEEKT